jgi:hypothetical protein
MLREQSAYAAGSGDSPQDLTVRELGKRVDLDLRGVLLLEDLVQFAKDIGSVLLRVLVKA